MFVWCFCLEVGRRIFMAGCRIKFLAWGRVLSLLSPGRRRLVIRYKSGGLPSVAERWLLRSPILHLYKISHHKLWQVLYYCYWCQILAVGTFCIIKHIIFYSSDGSTTCGVDMIMEWGNWVSYTEMLKLNLRGSYGKLKVTREMFGSTEVSLLI